MKTQSINKLAFKKSAILELNKDQLNAVNGGSTPGCVPEPTEVFVALVSSISCLIVIEFL